MEKKIYYHDTDAGGVVYYGNYLKYLEEARTEFLEQRGLSVQKLEKKGLLYAVRDCHVFYKSPAKYGETIVCTAVLKKVTAARFIFEQKIFEKKSQRLILESEVTLASLNKDFKPTPIPEELKELLG